MLPYIGLRSLVIFSACINWLRLFKPDVELYMPEYISPVALLSSSYGSSNTADALVPTSIKGALKSSLILFDSTPLPKVKQFYQFKVYGLPQSDIGKASLAS